MCIRDRATAYAKTSEGLGLRAEVLPEPMGHGAINKDLGEDNDSTRGVEAFMAKRDPAVSALPRR